jgi:hypothetical protein
MLSECPRDWQMLASRLQGRHLPARLSQELLPSAQSTHLGSPDLLPSGVQWGHVHL